MFTMPDRVYRQFLFYHLCKCKKVQAPHLADVPSILEKASPRSWGKKGLGESPTLCGRKKCRLKANKQNSSQVGEIFSVCWWSHGKLSPILQHCPILAACHHYWVTDAAPQGTLSSAPCQSFIRADSPSQGINILENTADGEYFKVPFILVEGKGFISNNSLSSNHHPLRVVLLWPYLKL